MLDSVLIWIDRNKRTWLHDVKAWLSIPSISAQPQHDKDTRDAAEWAVLNLRTIGLDAKLVETSRHPCVLATTPPALCPANAPHVLLYGHYDVQPPEPLDLWLSPPFEPTVRDNKLFARGACDDKGQVHCHLAALLAWREINGQLPCRVTVILEGEEEIGSPNLMGVVNAHHDLLASAKTLIISDVNQFADGVPAIVYGLRGLAGFELFVRGANTDLHSGMYGGTVQNPANALAAIIAALHDSEGRITIPGFYNDVAGLTAEEERQWAQLPFSEADFAKELGVNQLWGEKGFSTLARKWARPTLDVNGLTSGYQGAGSKTVLPCVASAKITMRLVPNQDPLKIQDLFESYVQNLVPPGVTMEIRRYGASPPALTPVDSPAMVAAADALEIGFGKRPVFMREGGSIPVVAWFKEALGLDTVMVGFGLPDDRIHAPNEKLNLDCYFNGIKTAAALYDRLASGLN
jgi:acetylornithine deacetylase/succinyl-diaminopimelate desuccinylase-like protein